jgi:hypothetical protein
VTLAEFQHLLDAYGADTQRWPEAQRQAARNLIAQDDSARAAHAAAARLDGLLDRFDPPVAADSAARVAARLRLLPPQPAFGLGWAAALAELWWELRAVPRIPAIVAAVLLGFVVGVASLDMALGPSTRPGGRVDLSNLLFEPTPSDWLQL